MNAHASDKTRILALAAVATLGFGLLQGARLLDLNTVSYTHLRTFRARQRFRQHLLQPRAYRRALARTHLFRKRIATSQHARAQLFFRLHRPQYSIDVTAPLHDNGGGVGS